MNRKKKLNYWFLLLLAAMLIVTSCGENTTINEPNNQVENEVNRQELTEAEQEKYDQTPLQTAYPLTITDETGFELILEAEPQAIVSLAPSETEIVFAVNSGDRVVGVDQFSDYPEEARQISKIGDQHTNIEAVLSLDPDFVLANSSMNTEAIQQLRQLGYQVYASDPATYDATISHIEKVGLLLNKQEEANAVAAHMKQVKLDIETSLKDVSSKKVYLEFSPGWTIGSDVFLDDLVQIAGGENIASAQSGWFEVDAEVVIDQNPEVIIYPNFGEEQSSILAALLSRPGWDVIDAIKQQRIVEVSNEPLVRVGPRLADGLIEIAAAIHPERFGHD